MSRIMTRKFGAVVIGVGFGILLAFYRPDILLMAFMLLLITIGAINLCMYLGNRKKNLFK